MPFNLCKKFKSPKPNPKNQKFKRKKGITMSNNVKKSKNNNLKTGNLTQFARGSWQHSICHNLEKDGIIRHPISQLRGTASDYSGHYRNSLDNLLSRIKKAGINIEYIPGVRGGEWTAQYKLV